MPEENFEFRQLHHSLFQEREKSKPKETGVTAKFSEKEKEEIRLFALQMNTGMSTLLFEAWHFYREFYEVRHIMRRFRQVFIDLANSMSKNF